MSHFYSRLIVIKTTNRNLENISYHPGRRGDALIRWCGAPRTKMPGKMETFEISPMREPEKVPERAWSTTTLVFACLVIAAVVGVACTLTTYYLHPDFLPNRGEPPIVGLPTTMTSTGMTEEPSKKPTERLTKRSTEDGIITMTTTEDPAPHSTRINCIPDRDEPTDPEQVCMERGCTWESTVVEGEPSCYFPDNYGAYKVVREERYGWGVRLRMDRIPSVPSFFNGDALTIVVDIEPQTDNRVHFKVWFCKIVTFIFLISTFLHRFGDCYDKKTKMV